MDEVLSELEALSREALVLRWTEVIGTPPPKHLSRTLMVQVLFYEHQLRCTGGYTKRLDQRLRSAARRDVLRPGFKPGTRFVREHRGVTHIVEVDPEGLFKWNEQRFKTLTQAARAIAGYHTSGFQFFGVKP
jgi:hypothetical protein